MASLLPVSSSSSSSAAAFPTLKRRRDDEIGTQSDSAKLLFDPETLCNQIYFTLLDEPPMKAAGVIASTNPDILSCLCHYTQQELVGHLTLYTAGYEEKEQKQIERTLEILHSMSLRNSSFNISSQILEREIEGRVKALKERDLFQDLIQKASALLDEAPREDVKGLQNQISRIAEVVGKISELNTLFWYVDPRHSERIVNIYTNAKEFDGTLLFPKCKKYFGEFCQILALKEHDRAHLMQLSHKLHAKIGELQQKLTSLFAPSTLPPALEAFLKHEAVCFWKAGAQLLADAFRATFQDSVIPKQFVSAVQSTSRIDGFHQLTATNLLNNGFGDLDERFVDQVWVTFLSDPAINDVDDFMKHIMTRMPEETFEKLKTALNTSQDKKQTVLDSLNDFLRSQIRGKLTFTTLKAWTQKQTL